MHYSIIANILSVEDSAAKIVEDAEKEARDIIFCAESKARGHVTEELERTRREGDDIIKAEQEHLDQEIRAHEEKLSELEKNSVAIDDESLERASRRIVELLRGSRN